MQEKQNRRHTTDDVKITDPRYTDLRLKNHGGCELCHERSGELQVHAINPEPEARKHSANYVLVCEDCHAKIGSPHCYAYADAHGVAHDEEGYDG